MLRLAAKVVLVAATVSLLTCSKRPDGRNRIDVHELAALLDRIADWQIANFEYLPEGSSGSLHDHGIDSWTNATLYTGLSRWAEVAPAPQEHLDWLLSIGEKNGWAMPANFTDYSYGFHHADELCVGQFYLGMWERYRRPEMLAGVVERVAAIMADPPSADMRAGAKQSWTWCDALFMAPPVYAALASIEGDARYLAFMDTMFKRTYDHLYNEADGLFFRDDTYFDQKEANGGNVYWGRGNGWVAAGLAGILRSLPRDSPYRPFYEDIFRSFVPRLVELQDDGGAWHASLLDPDSYPAPETSATALITYAVAFGVNNSLLDPATYTPAALKGWQTITRAVDADGRVGWIQPIGASPKATTAESTAVYGVGAVLMAGAEIYKMNSLTKCKIN